MFLLRYFLAGFLTATVLALLEIQIEGKHALAAKLPTWRIKSRFFPRHPWIATGYHIYLWLLLFVLMHMPFVFIQWGMRQESVLLSMYVLVLGLEDFLWFVFNPHYGLRKFNRKIAWWHLQWWGPMPMLYYPGIVLWAALLFWGISG